jgi:hypothetical protein
MNRRHTWLAAIVAVAALGTAQADVLFDFESGVQSWFRFGSGTLDFGPATGQGSVGNGIYYVTDLSPSIGFGAVRSPGLGTAGIDLSQYVGFSADVQLSTDNLSPAYPGPGPQIELMLQLPGYLEWVATATPAYGPYTTISANFADLVPQASATQAITPEQLANPNLQIRVLLRNLERDPEDPSGKIRLRVDQVSAFVPEPASLALLALGGVALLKRRS